MYCPDKWLVVKISQDENTFNYHVFATWSGSYLGGSSWRMNSGIESVSIEDKIIVFKGFSGSEYHCHIESYGNTGYGTSVLDRLIETSKESGITIEVMPSGTDWSAIDYS